jgi:hypothetical protein
VSNGYQENGGNVNYIEKYNITDNKWSVIILVSFPKDFSNSETYNNKIYIFLTVETYLEIVDLATYKITKILIIPIQEIQGLQSTMVKYMCLGAWIKWSRHYCISKDFSIMILLQYMESITGYAHSQRNKRQN